jgi:hypothetical protein
MGQSLHFSNSKPTSGAPQIFFEAKPRGRTTRTKQGQFITKSEGQLRETWAKEGGYEANVQRVLATEQAILGLSENPQALQSAINELPKDIALKAADAMRLATSYREGGAIKFGMFIDSLSPSEYQTFETWWRKLSRGDQDAILAGISR